MRIRGRRLAGRRPALTAATALVPVLALTAACGGSGHGSAAKPKDGVLPAAALSKALLTSKDISHVQVVPASAKVQLFGGAQKIDTPACAPVADQWSISPAHPRHAYAGAMVTDTAAKDPKAKTITLEVVASYRPGEARSVLDALATALKTCHGYRTTRNGTTTAFTVKAVAVSGGHLGDQQVIYTITDAAAGAASSVLVTVVRAGNATAAYETVRADHGPAALRPAIPQKQTDKLRSAGAGG